MLYYPHRLTAMKIIQTSNKFYLTTDQDRITICTKLGVCSYPVWLGKNRAVFKKVLRIIDKNPPESVYDFLDIVGHYELQGFSTGEAPIYELFTKKVEKKVDKKGIFW